jgi:hypothetical protein
VSARTAEGREGEGGGEGRGGEGGRGEGREVRPHGRNPEQYKFGEHFVKSLVDLVHTTEEGCQWVKKVLKEQNRAFNVDPPPKLVMSKIQR